MEERHEDALEYLVKYKTALGLSGDFNPADWKQMYNGSINARLYGKAYLQPRVDIICQAAALV